MYRGHIYERNYCFDHNTRRDFGFDVYRSAEVWDNYEVRTEKIQSCWLGLTPWLHDFDFLIVTIGLQFAKGKLRDKQFQKFMFCDKFNKFEIKSF